MTGPDVARRERAPGLDILPKPSHAYELVVIGTSAGGLEAVCRLLGGLTPEFPIPIVVVQHLAPSRTSQLAAILGRSTSMPVTEVRDHARMEPGHVYVAPPDRHTVFDADGLLALNHDAAVNYVRPSADMLFESAAEQFGVGALGVVLTGFGKDGAAGASAIKRHGGTVIAQDEATSAHFGMPRAAIRTGHVDHVMPLEDIAPTLERLVGNGGTP